MLLVVVPDSHKGKTGEKMHENITLKHLDIPFNATFPNSTRVTVAVNTHQELKQVKKKKGDK